MKYVLIEFVDEYKAFLEFLGTVNGRLEDYAIVAIEPKLEAYLAVNGVKYRNTLDYFDTESHKRILAATDKVMELIEKEFGFTDSSGLARCYEKEAAHYIRLYMNHMYKILEALDAIRASDSGCELYACGGGSMAASALISDNERYLARLAAGFAQAHGLVFAEIGKHGGPVVRARKDGLSVRPNPVVKVLSRAMLSFFTGTKTVFVPRIGQVFKGVMSRLNAQDGKIAFVAIDYTGGFLHAAAFNALSCVRTFLGKQQYRYFIVNPVFFGAYVTYDEGERLMKCVDEIVERKGVFEYCGVDCRELVKMKVDAGLKAHLLRMLHAAHNLGYLFNRMKRWMVIAFSGLDSMAIAGELARALGANALFVSHGSHPVPTDEYHEMELLRMCRSFMLGDYTHVALSNPVQEEHLHYFKRKYNWVRNLEIKTGPLVFTNILDADRSAGKERLGIPPGDIVLTHATTTKGRHGERYYFVETLDEFFASLADLIRCVEARKGVTLLIRLHPGFPLNDDEMKSLLPASKKIVIHRVGPFGDALAATDVLVSYSSTAIEEALLNGIPVLLYDRWNRYNHYRTPVFNGPSSSGIFPVCYVNAREKLTEALEFMLGKAAGSSAMGFDKSRFSYKDDYSGNLYEFVKSSLNARPPGGLS